MDFVMDLIFWREFECVIRGFLLRIGDLEGSNIMRVELSAAVICLMRRRRSLVSK